MANLQRSVISLLLVLTASFLFFAHLSEATKGPKITNKVGLYPFGLNKQTLIYFAT